MDIQAVAFDVDGTLYPNYKMYLHSLPSAIRYPRLAWAFGQARKLIRENENIEDFRGLQAEIVAGLLGLETEKASRLIEYHLYKVWERTFKGIKPYSDVRDFILHLRSEGFKTGVLSDFPVANKLEYMGLADLWDCAFTSEDTQYLKPDPRPFQELADRLDTPPKKILYVGNSFKYDVLGANKVGMYTAYLSKKQAPEATITFRTYTELQEILDDRLNIKKEN